VIEKLTGKWVGSFEDLEGQYRELIERTGDDREAMSEDGERIEIRHSAVTLTLADATVFPPGSPHFTVPVLSTIPFGHGRVTQAALDDFYGREERLVAPLSSDASGYVLDPVWQDARSRVAT
jgi:hypothetical protein